MDELQKNIVEWTKLNQELKEINKHAMIIRSKKESLQNKIIPIIQINHLEDNIFSIPKLKSNISLNKKTILQYSNRVVLNIIKKTLTRIS